MDRKKVMELFNKRPRIGSLSTANRKGEVNVAVFGSPQMIDENTVVMGIGRNRSFANLQENPKAVFIVVEPGETVMDWKGARVYLEAMDVETGGGFYEQINEFITFLEQFDTDLSETRVLDLRLDNMIVQTGEKK